MSPNGLFSETLDMLAENTDVTTRLGMPVHGYGHDHGGHREGRRNRIEHVNLKDKDGNPRLRCASVINFTSRSPVAYRSPLTTTLVIIHTASSSTSRAHRATRTCSPR